MRKIVFATLFFVGLLSLNACKNKEKNENVDKVNDSIPKTSMTFDSDNFDFGTITSGEVVEHVFNFTNSGDVDLKIEDVQASCGCTTPDYTKNPVKPGEKGMIQVKFNTKNREGNQVKKVTVFANTNPEATVLRFTAKVKKQE